MEKKLERSSGRMYWEFSDGTRVADCGERLDGSCYKEFGCRPSYTPNRIEIDLTKISSKYKKEIEEKEGENVVILETLAYIKGR